jgi:hypothetical protein
MVSASAKHSPLCEGIGHEMNEVPSVFDANPGTRKEKHEIATKKS